MVTFLEPPSEFIPAKPRKRRNKQRVSGARRMEDREFIAWDGEGWTEHVCGNADNCINQSGKCKHHYYLFGCSSGEYITADSLCTADCFDVMLDSRRNHPNAIHVAFSFKYDIDMILRDIPPAGMRYLMKHNRMKWKGYLIEVLPGKWFQVTRDELTCRIYDLFSFFACSFVKALEKWNVGTEAELSEIAKVKSERSTFNLDNLESEVIPYWQSELRLLASLAERLRDILYSAGIRPAMWHGPGAVANFLFKSRKTQLTMPEYDSIPEGVKDAGQFAYAGGRFEAFRIGYYDGPVYSADINSAYPYAMSMLPNMATGVWIHGTSLPGMQELEEFRVGMFHVRYRYNNEWRRNLIYDGFPGVAHYRYHGSGTVHFRDRNPGVWVHLPEMRILLEQYRLGMFASFEVVESWIYMDDGTYPFDWVKEIYEQRREWKAQGNPAQLAAKLGINSLYGKLAQRVGGRTGKPRWHNLEMAGHITSTCRAMLYEASWRQHRDVIAFQTDGIYSTQPLDFVPNGEGAELGQWEKEEYSAMLHLQSGVYWLRGMDGIWKRPKSRGVPQQHMSFDKAMESLKSQTPLIVEQTQFIRFGLANMRRAGLRNWRTWQINEKEFSFGGAGIGDPGKRIHVKPSCKECVQGYGFDESLHTLMLSPKGYPRRNGKILESAAHHLPWRSIGEPNPLKEETDLMERWGETNDG